MGQRADGEGNARAAARLQISVHGRRIVGSLVLVLRPGSRVLSPVLVQGPESRVVRPRSTCRVDHYEDRRPRGFGWARQPHVGAHAGGSVRDRRRPRCADVSRGSRVLAIIPDRTRDDNTPVLFPIVSQHLARLGAARLDALVAQGTHPPMADADKRAKIGWGDADIPLLGEVYDHHWDRSETLQTIGTLSSAHVATLTWAC